MRDLELSSFEDQGVALNILIIFVKNFIIVDHSLFIKQYRDQNQLHIREGNGKVISIYPLERWNSSMGENWVILLFDLFQIRTVGGHFSEVALDIVDFASKPTIYRTEPNRLLPSGLADQKEIRFSLVREPNWKKLLFQISQPIIAQIGVETKADVETKLNFPLLGPNVKELYLGAEGDVKIIKG